MVQLLCETFFKTALIMNARGKCAYVAFQMDINDFEIIDNDG